MKTDSPTQIRISSALNAELKDLVEKVGLFSVASFSEQILREFNDGARSKKHIGIPLLRWARSALKHEDFGDDQGLIRMLLEKTARLEAENKHLRDREGGTNGGGKSKAA